MAAPHPQQHVSHTDRRKQQPGLCCAHSFQGRMGCFDALFLNADFSGGGSDSGFADGEAVDQLDQPSKGAAAIGATVPP